MPLNLDKLDDYYLYFAAIPTAWGLGLMFFEGTSAVPMGIAILIACAVLPTVDHMRANITDDSAIKRIRSWLFMMTSTGVMAFLIGGVSSVYNIASWVGVSALFILVWVVVIQFRKTVGVDLDPYDRMYLASGEVIGFFVPIIMYIAAIMLGSLSLLRAGSPAIPSFFLVLAWAEGLLTIIVIKTETISRKLLTFPPDAVHRRGRDGRFFRTLEELFPYLNLAMLGMAAESGLRTRWVGTTFVISVAAFLSLGVTVPDVTALGWELITLQCILANVALIANLVLYSRLSTAEIMRAGWLPKF
ncbi:MAG TPA: hypothetical protein VGR56_02665 [Nitrososphaerales archaeon]|nr:hypothetical protein [Nitrososphaerales archaeon]